MKRQHRYVKYVKGQAVMAWWDITEAQYEFRKSIGLTSLRTVTKDTPNMDSPVYLGGAPR